MKQILNLLVCLLLLSACSNEASFVDPVEESQGFKQVVLTVNDVMSFELPEFWVFAGAEL